MIKIYLQRPQLVFLFFPLTAEKNEKRKKIQRKHWINNAYKRICKIWRKFNNNWIRPLLLALLIDLIKAHWEGIINKMVELFQPN